MKMQRTMTITDGNDTDTFIPCLQGVSMEPEAVQIPPVHSLPPEILSKIFLLTVSGSYSILESLHDGPWLLGRVCRRWRDISQTYPALWSSFVLANWELELAGEIGPRMFREALRRTKQNGLSMTIWIYHIFPDTIIETLMQHSRQWEDICLLGGPSSQWTRSLLDFPQVDFPSLRSLSMRYQDSMDDLATILGMFRNAPNLRSLGFDFDVKMPPFGMSTIPFPWPHITHLTMSFAKFSRVELIVALLCLCPSLQMLTERTVLHCDSEVATIAPLTFLKLRSLGLEYSHFLLSSLTCPVLEYLSFTMPHADHPSPNLTISQFFARSGSQLQTLTLRISQDTLDPDQFFSYIPRLRKLVLLLADSENDSDPARFLKGLSGERGVMLPSLSVLELSANKLFTDDIRLEGRNELLVSIIEKRWNVPRDPRLTRLSHVRVRTWNPITRVGGHVALTPKASSCVDRLKSFKVEGLDISIIIDEEVEDAPSEERVLL
ncbi:hypothetical protein EV421DRAFT_1810115 [Armillaria borealis]|uniref:F-box domain-containing protein n=1 Tax=Armillaria borealis TaxID=47425 RepID=A0AA39MPV0_9AGAR|nr:hypothetical protein EV421DRAFT_1810115 [Armillaria borealis]